MRLNQVVRVANGGPGAAPASEQQVALWARLPGSGGGHAERLPVRRRAAGLTPEASRTAVRDAVRQSAHRADHGAHRRECQVYHREYGPGVSRLWEAGGSGTPGLKPGRARGRVCSSPLCQGLDFGKRGARDWLFEAAVPSRRLIFIPQGGQFYSEGLHR